jgi:hypothetical protein
MEWFIGEVKNLAVERGGPAPLLKGRDILGLGVAPGPAVGKILAEVYEQQLDSKVQTRDEALAAARLILVRCRLDIIPVVGPPSRDAGSGI